MLNDPATIPRRPLYLHFLNRELIRNSGSRLTRDQLEGLVQLCLLTSHGPLMSSTALLLESGIAKEPLAPWLQLSLDTGQLRLISEFGTVAKFLESARGMYQHDASRYPMYFQESDLDIAAPTVIKSSSSTLDIEQRLVALLDHGEDDWRNLHWRDVTAIANNLRSIEQIIAGRAGRAYTLSIFREFSTDPETSEAIARFVSYLHTRLYVEFAEADLLTGLPHLEWLDLASPTFPSRDYAWTNRFLRASGMRRDDLQRDAVWMVAGRATPTHVELVARLQTLTGAVFRVGLPPTLTPQQAARHPALFQRRKELLSPLLTAAHDQWAGRPLPSRDRFIPELATRLTQMSMMMSQRSRAFAAVIEEEQRRMETQPTKVLLFVATEVEQRTVLATAGRFTGSDYVPIHLAYHTAFNLGLIGGTEVLLVRSGQAVNDPGGATMTAADAIDQLKPAYLIAVGTGYSLKNCGPEDVMVMTQLKILDHRKLTPREDINRGDGPGVSITLRDRLQTASLEPSSYKVVFGQMLTSSTLINQSRFRSELKRRYPDAIGGEMEAAGVYSAAAKRGVDWIVVKGVSDKGVNKNDAHQAAAINNAADLVFRAIAAGGLSRPPGR